MGRVANTTRGLPLDRPPTNVAPPHPPPHTQAKSTTFRKSIRPPQNTPWDLWPKDAFRANTKPYTTPGSCRHCTTIGHRG